MKRFLSFFLVISITSAVFAQVTSGYYRVKNTTTGRYLYVCDNRGEAKLDGIDVKVDLDAIFLRADLSNAISDPASIIYVENNGNNLYNFWSQGTSVHEIIDNYLSLNARNGSYAVGATIKGVARYLTDKKTSSSSGFGIISTDGDAKFWDPIPVSSASDNYFGVAPTLSSNGKFYSTFYASFGVKTVSAESTKFYYVANISDNAVLLKELSSQIPGETPVIIESNSNNASDNKLDILDGGSAPSDNMLRGVFFNTDNSDASYAVKVHVNQVKSDSSTRILSVNQDGELVFTNSCPLYLPANSAYLKVGSSAQSVLKVCFTQNDFDNATSLEGVNLGKSNLVIYNLLGKVVANTESLPAGIYIIGGKKTVIR